jgi:enamine deaminase RidA (YjgF/YER057c/UK114 family)
VGEAYRRIMGKHFPAMALVEVRGLLEDEARIEIEAVALV